MNDRREDVALSESQGLRFDIFERVRLIEEINGLDRLDEIELSPHIQVLSQEDQAVLRGHLQLTAKFAESDGIRGTLLEHQIPVEITLPMKRVPNLDQIRANIDHFDVDLVSPNTLNVTGTLSLSGIDFTQEMSEWRNEQHNEEVFVHHAQQTVNVDGEPAKSATTERTGDPSSQPDELVREEAAVKPEPKPEPQAPPKVQESTKPLKKPEQVPEQPKMHALPKSQANPAPPKIKDEVNMKPNVEPDVEPEQYNPKLNSNAHVTPTGELNPKPSMHPAGELNAKSNIEPIAEPLVKPNAPPPSKAANEAAELSAEMESRETTDTEASEENVAVEAATERETEAAIDADTTETPLEKEGVRIAFSGRKQDVAEPMNSQQIQSLFDNSHTSGRAAENPQGIAEKGEDARIAKKAASPRSEHDYTDQPSNGVDEDTHADTEHSGDALEWKRLFLSRESEEQRFSSVRMCIVQKEETIETIAERYKLNPREIVLYNGLSDQGVSEGQVLYIP